MQKFKSGKRGKNVFLLILLSHVPLVNSRLKTSIITGGILVTRG